jgi:hypothetical protein
MANPKRSAEDAAQSALPDSIGLTDVEAALAARVAPGESVVWAEDAPAFKEALRALNRIEKRHGLTDAECHQLREALTTEVFLRQLKPRLPDEAPELWSERRGMRDNPVTFIRRVYAPWLGRGLQRAHLHSLDRPLYTALGVWLHRHPETGFPELDG